MGRSKFMGKKDETLCDWPRTRFAEHEEDFRKAVLPPRFACRKCGRVAAAKKWLCKSYPLD